MFNSLQSKTVGDVVAPNLVVEEKTSDEPDKEAGITASTTQDHHQESDDDTIDTDAQAGVRAIEATTSVWSKRDLIIAYCL